MATLLSLIAFRITFRVAEPAGLARRLPPLANGVTDQGLGGRSEATGAGNPVLYEVMAPKRPCHDGKAGFAPLNTFQHQPSVL